jgi:hypothetical protein
MRFPVDVAAHVSAELSAIIDGLINDPDVEEPVTLGVVRRSVAGSLLGGMEEVEQLHSDARQTLLAEIDDLIERFGADALAEHLLRYE